MQDPLNGCGCEKGSSGVGVTVACLEVVDDGVELGLALLGPLRHRLEVVRAILLNTLLRQLVHVRLTHRTYSQIRNKLTEYRFLIKSNKRILIVSISIYTPFTDMDHKNTTML